MYCERNRIERMIGHLKINRAIATRYDKLVRSFLGALSADAYAMQLCKQDLALICAGRLQSIRANTCSRFVKNCCHPYLAPW
jgi:hypothetical protein